MNSLLKILESKDRFFKYKSLIKEHTLSKEVVVVIKDMEEWFTKNPSFDTIDWDNFSVWFSTIKHPSFKAEKQSVYKKMFDVLIEDEFDEDMLQPIVESYIEKDHAMKIADWCLRITEGDDSKALLEVEDFISTYKSESKKVTELDDYISTKDVNELLKQTTGGLTWRLNELNRSLGSINKGDFITVSAYVDTGKTTFLASEVSNMVKQLEEGQCVLWFNNEEGKEKITRRVMQACLGVTLSDLKDMAETDPIGLKTALEHERFFDIHVFGGVNTTREIEKIISDYNVGLIVMDQLWKVQGFKDNSFGEIEQQTKLFAWARKLAQDTCPLINVHQAQGDCNGVQYIEMHQLYNSRVGIQGELDGLITIGRDLEPGYERVRFIYVPKNKLETGTEPMERNGKYEVEILPEIARYRGVY